MQAARKPKKQPTEPVLDGGPYFSAVAISEAFYTEERKPIFRKVGVTNHVALADLLEALANECSYRRPDLAFHFLDRYCDSLEHPTVISIRNLLAETAATVAGPRASTLMADYEEWRTSYMRGADDTYNFFVHWMKKRKLESAYIEVVVDRIRYLPPEKVKKVAGKVILGNGIDGY